MPLYSSLRDFIVQFAEIISSAIKSVVTFLKYIPKLLQIISYAVSEMTSMFNMLPQLLFLVGSIILFIAFWYLIFGR